MRRQQGISLLETMMIGLGLTFVVVTGFAIYGEIQWHKWADQHCKVIGSISGDTVFGIGANGQMTTAYVPGKTGYRCDDGMEYWR